MKKFLSNPSAPISAITVLVLLAALAGSASFRTPYNFNNIVIQMVALGLVALGQSFAILVGDVDLCVGGIISLTTVVAATFMKDGTASILSIAVLTLAAGIVAGLVNGWLVSAIKIDAMVTTFATNSILLGFALWVMEAPGGFIPRAYMAIVEA